jgi:hypothetical protein
MRWTPSIVPRGDDQNVYLVVDDFGRNGRVYREADVETADLETVIIDLLDGQLTQSKSSASTPPKAGRRTFRKISPKNYAVAVTCNCVTCRRSFRASLRPMKATSVSSH